MHIRHLKLTIQNAVINIIQLIPCSTEPANSIPTIFWLVQVIITGNLLFRVINKVTFMILETGSSFELKPA